MIVLICGEVNTMHAHAVLLMNAYVELYCHVDFASWLCLVALQNDVTLFEAVPCGTTVSVQPFARKCDFQGLGETGIEHNHSRGSHLEVALSGGIVRSVVPGCPDYTTL